MGFGGFRCQTRSTQRAEVEPEVALEISPTTLEVLQATLATLTLSDRKLEDIGNVTTPEMVM